MTEFAITPLALPLVLAAWVSVGAAGGPGFREVEARTGPSLEAQPDVREATASTAKTLVFTGARILPVASAPIENGVLVVREGRIEALGSRDSTPVPASAEVRDLSGLVIVPGFVDTHSHLGGASGADSTDPIQPEVRVLDSIDVRSSGFQRAQAGGVTTVNVMPGSGHLMSGQTVYLKLRDATTLSELILESSRGVTGGMKMANGTNSQGSAPFPGTRAKSAALVRARFIEAQAYREKLTRSEAEPENPELAVERDLALEALVEVLEGKRVVHHHTHRHDDVLTVLRLAEEFGFRVVLHHVSDAWKVADEIAAAGAPCSIILVDSPGGKLEARDLRFENGAVLEQAGVEVAFHTDDWITDSRLFSRSAGLAVRAGMSPEKALEALTLAPARMLDLEHRLGSLEVGKDADFVILSGDPFSTYTQVLETWVEGERVFDRSIEQDRTYAVGGRGAGQDYEPGIICCGEENNR